MGMPAELEVDASTLSTVKVIGLVIQDNGEG